MTEAKRCPQCGATLMSGSQSGMCARCLLAAALGQPAAGSLGIPQPGDRIGPYRILRLLGEGGMGLVYLAEQEEPIARQVALKIIKLGMDTRAVLARFESEQQALALMEHPNIAQVFDAGSSAQGRPYFVMEYVQGVPITEYCDRHRLGTRRRLELFLQVASGAQHAHQKGVIHRDLKPSNILVGERDGAAVPKIIDFGLAKATDRFYTAASLFTDAGLLIGTPEYMSPEQASPGAGDVDTRTDIYSLGVLLYELLVGTVPFESKYLRREGYDEIRRIIREDEPPAPASRLESLGDTASEIASCRATDTGGLRRQVRGDLDWIVMTAMAKDRDRRYASASELAADIARHLHDEPVMASPPSAAYRLGKFVRKNRGPVLALAAVILSLSLGLCASTILYFRAERQRVEAQQQRAEADRQRTAADQQRAEAHRQANQAERERAAADDARIAAGLQRQTAEQQHAEAERQRVIAEQQAAEARRRGAEATAAQSAAEKQREAAEQASRVALDQTRAAREERTAADQQRMLAQRQSYVANLIAADLHIRAHEIGEARRRLMLCPSSLRGWEWHYLLWKTDTSIASSSAPFAAPGSKPQFAFGPDGPRLLEAPGQVLAADASGHRIVSTAAGAIHVYDASGKALSTLGPLHGDTTCAALAPHSDRLVTGARDGSLTIWNGAKPLAPLDAHKGGVLAVAISSDSQRAVSAGEDHLVRIWDAASGHAMYSIAGHAGPVLAVAFSPDRRFIVSGSSDKTARIWDAATGRALHTLTGHECAVPAVAISPDGMTVATASCSTIRLWDMESGKPVVTLPADWRGDIAALAFSPDGARIAAASSAEIKTWNARTYGGAILLRASADTDRIAIAPNGAHLALHNAKTQTVEVWDAHTRAAQWTVRDTPAIALAFSADGARLAAALSDCTVRLWNALTGLPAGPARIPAPSAPLAFSSDSARLVWDLPSAARIFAAAAPASIQAAVASPDGRHIAIGTANHALFIWDSASSADPVALKLPPGSGPVAAAAWSPDGKRVAAAIDAGSIAVWDIASGQQLALLKGHSAPVNALAFTPDGSRLISASRDKTMRLWDAATFDSLLIMGDRDETVISLVFSQDARILYSASAEKTVRIWNTE